MSKEFKKIMARKMKNQHRIRVSSKELAADIFKAKVNKKKIPDIPIPRSKKDPSYSKMSIKEYERKFL